MNRIDYLDKRYTESRIPIVLIFLGVFAFLYFFMGGSYALLNNEFIDFGSFRGSTISLMVISSLVFFIWLLIGNIRVAVETMLVAKRVSVDNDIEFESFIGVRKKIDRNSVLSIEKVRPVSRFWSMSLLSKEKRNYKILFSDSRKIFLSGEIPEVAKLMDDLSSIRQETSG